MKQKETCSERVFKVKRKALSNIAAVWCSAQFICTLFSIMLLESTLCSMEALVGMPFIYYQDVIYSLIVLICIKCENTFFFQCNLTELSYIQGHNIKNIS